MLLSDFFESVYVPRKLRGRSQNSIRLYRLCIRQFERTLGRPPQVADLTEDHVLAHLARRSDVAPATRNKELAELKAMWRLASQKGYLTTWPDIEDEPEPEQAPVAWLQDELRQLLAACARQEGFVAGVPAHLWWSGVVRVIVDTGERISAVMRCEYSWLSGDWLMVPASARKGKTRDRHYKITPETRSIIESIRLHGAHPTQVFPWTLTPTYVWDRYAAILRAAGLPTGRKRSFHAVRKTHGSAVYAAGLDPQDALDHSDRRTTLRYLDPRFKQKIHASDILAAYLRRDNASDDGGHDQKRDCG